MGRIKAGLAVATALVLGGCTSRGMSSEPVDWAFFEGRSTLVSCPAGSLPTMACLDVSVTNVEDLAGSITCRVGVSWSHEDRQVRTVRFGPMEPGDVERRSTVWFSNSNGGGAPVSSYLSCPQERPL